MLRVRTRTASLIGGLALALAACVTVSPAGPTPVGSSPAASPTARPRVSSTPAPPPTARATPTLGSSPSPTSEPTIEPTVEPTAISTDTPGPTSGSVLGPGGRLEVPTDGFALTVPDDWASLDLDGLDLTTIADTLEATDPELADTVRGFAASGQQISIFAFAPVVPGDVVPESVNVIVAANIGATAQFLKQSSIAVLEGFDQVQGDVASADTDFGPLPGFRLSYALAATDAAGESVTEQVTQFVFVSPSKAYAITFGDDSAHASAWRAIATTFELLP